MSRAPKRIQNLDGLLRMNFLIQAAALTAYPKKHKHEFQISSVNSASSESELFTHESSKTVMSETQSANFEGKNSRDEQENSTNSTQFNTINKEKIQTNPNSYSIKTDLNTIDVDYDVARAASRHYTRTLVQISQKLVLRMSPGVKRSLCKKCGTFLIPGNTSSSIRVKTVARRKMLSSTCGTCHDAKKKIL